MSKDKVEEKANNAQLFLIENKLNDLVISPLWCKDKVYVSDTLMEYTDSLSTETAQLREALREAFNLICDSTEYEVGINRYKDGVLKIKQLLTDKE